MEDEQILICEECAQEIAPGDDREFDGSIVCSGCYDELSVRDDTDSE